MNFFIFQNRRFLETSKTCFLLLFSNISAIYKAIILIFSVNVPTPRRASRTTPRFELKVRATQIYMPHFWKKWKKVQDEITEPENLVFGKFN